MLGSQINEANYQMQYKLVIPVNQSLGLGFGLKTNSGSPGNVYSVFGQIKF